MGGDDKLNEWVMMTRKRGCDMITRKRGCVMVVREGVLWLIERVYYG